MARLVKSIGMDRRIPDQPIEIGLDVHYRPPVSRGCEPEKSYDSLTKRGCLELGMFIKITALDH